MSYKLDKNEAPGPGLQRIAAREVRYMLETIRDEEHPVDYRVHELRKSCKKLRAIVRLMRPGFDEYRQANVFFRDLARRASAHRDARIKSDLVDELDGSDSVSAPEVGVAERWYGLRCELAEEHAQALLKELEEPIAAAALDIERWDVDGITREHIVAGLAKTLGRARGCYEELVQHPDTPPVRLFHEWRKRCKYHRLHLDLLADWLPGGGHKRGERFDELASLIGDAHDCSVLIEDIAAEPAYLRERVDVRQLSTALMQKRRKLRREALRVADGLFDDDPEAIASHLVP